MIGIVVWMNIDKFYVRVASQHRWQRKGIKRIKWKDTLAAIWITPRPSPFCSPESIPCRNSRWNHTFGECAYQQVFWQVRCVPTTRYCVQKYWKQIMYWNIQGVDLVEQKWDKLSVAVFGAVVQQFSSLAVHAQLVPAPFSSQLTYLNAHIRRMTAILFLSKSDRLGVRGERFWLSSRGISLSKKFLPLT